LSSSLKIPLTLVFSLLLLWVALTGSVKADSILVGLALSLLITFVTWKPLFSGSRHIYVHDPEPLNFRPLKALMALPGFMADLTKASAEVAILAIKPSIQLRPGIVRVHSHLKNKTTIVFLANYITLTPGTLTVDMDISRHDLFIHSLDLDSLDASSLRDEVVSMEGILGGVFE